MGTADTNGLLSEAFQLLLEWVVNLSFSEDFVYGEGETSPPI